jgi:hypothetical protein
LQKYHTFLPPIFLHKNFSVLFLIGGSAKPGKVNGFFLSNQAKQKKQRRNNMPKKSDSTKGEKKPRKTTKAKKDPKAPKRNKSAYFFFCDDKRAETKEKYPDLKITEISKKLAEQWKALTESDKKV